MHNFYAYSGVKLAAINTFWLFSTRLVAVACHLLIGGACRISVGYAWWFVEYKLHLVVEEISSY